MAIEAQKPDFNVLLAPQAMTNSATVTANLDTRDADYATILVSLSAELNTNAGGSSISILESDDTVATNFATYDSDFVRTAEDSTSAKVIAFHINKKGRKRYQQIKISTNTTTNDDMTVGAVGMLTRQRDASGSADVTVIG